MPSRRRGTTESLAHCFGSPLVRYTTLPAIGVDGIRASAVDRSPVHFRRGDMRRAYGWTRALLTAAVTVGGILLAVRLLLTGLFVTFVSPELSSVVVFNAFVTLLAGRLLLGRLGARYLRSPLGSAFASGGGGGSRRSSVAAAPRRRIPWPTEKERL